MKERDAEGGSDMFSSGVKYNGASTFLKVPSNVLHFFYFACQDI